MLFCSKLPILYLKLTTGLRTGELIARSKLPILYLKPIQKPIFRAFANVLNFQYFI